MSLVGRPATELAEAVREGRVSARDLVRTHLDHLAAVEPRLGAFTHVRAEAALADADVVDRRPDRFSLPLAGVPVVVKDTIDVAGSPTRWGSIATPEGPAERDHEVVARLRAAGAIVLGKTRCPELALWGTSDDATGTAVSPWDPTRSAGGSSGGSAAAVSAGVAPIGVASDGLGSARIPAVACGAFAIKPGSGLLSDRLDGQHRWFGMARFGPITTTVADAALAIDVMADTRHLREPRPVGRALSVAVSFRAPTPAIVVGAAWREAAVEAGRLLRHAGHRVQREDPPYEPATVQAGVNRWLQGVVNDVELLGIDASLLQPRTRAHLARGARLARRRAVRADDARRWRDRLEPFFERHDLLVTPAFARAQPAAEAWRRRPWAANMAANVSTYPFFGAWSLADLPAAVVPLWQARGRPLAVQLVAPQGREDLLLSVAALLESLVPWARHAPGWGVPAGLDAADQPGGGEAGASPSGGAPGASEG